MLLEIDGVRVVGLTDPADIAKVRRAICACASPETTREWILSSFTAHAIVISGQEHIISSTHAFSARSACALDLSPPPLCGMFQRPPRVRYLGGTSG